MLALSVVIILAANNREQDSNASVSVAGMSSGPLPDAPRKRPTWRLRLVSLRRAGPDGHVRHDRFAASPLADAHGLLDVLSGSPFPSRAQYFPSSVSFKMSLSREKSATSFFRIGQAGLSI